MGFRKRASKKPRGWGTGRIGRTVEQPLWKRTWLSLSLGL